MAEEDTNLPFLMLRPTLGSGVPSITLWATRLGGIRDRESACGSLTW